MLRVSECSAAYAGAPVLSGLSLGVTPGETLAIVGPSGVGKTTLLLVIAGLKAPQSGEVTVNGKPVVAGDRRIGLVLQSYGLFPWFTAKRNVGLGLEIQGVEASDREAMVGEILERFGLGKLKSRYPRELSGGERQRLALARTFVLEPSILLLDEPFSALDALTREELQDFLLRVLENRPIATVVVTHSIEEAVYLGSRVAILGPSGSLSFCEGIRTAGSPNRRIDRGDPRFFESCTGLRRRLTEVLGA